MDKLSVFSDVAFINLFIINVNTFILMLAFQWLIDPKRFWIDRTTLSASNTMLTVPTLWRRKLVKLLQKTLINSLLLRIWVIDNAAWKFQNPA